MHWISFRKNPTAAIAAASLLLCLPLFWALSPDLNDADLSFYALILDGFSYQFWHGAWYPRWLNDVNGGYGSPVFLYYAPGAFYISSLLEWLHVFDPSGLMRFCVSLTCATVLSSVAFYHFARRHLEEKTAFTAALLYALFPYKLNILYVQTALAQQWATLFVFLALAYLTDWLRSATCFVRLTLCMAAVILCHIPTFITFAFLLPFYVIMLSPVPLATAILRAGAAFLLAMGIAAFYWLPLHDNLPYVQAAIFTEHAHKFFADNFWNHIHDVWMAPYVLLLPGAFLARKKILGENPLPPAKRFFYFLLGASLFFWFMTTPLSLPLWQSVALLPPLQFPFRFYALLSALLCLLAAMLLSRGLAERFIIPLWMALLLAQNGFFFLYAPHDHSGLMAQVYRDRWIVPPEYQTVWMPRWEPASSPFLPDGARFDPGASEVMISQGKGIIASPIRTPQGMIFRAAVFSSEATLRLKRFYFYNLQATDGRRKLALHTDPNGIAILTLPAGEHKVSIEEGPYKGAEAGRAIALVSVLVLCAHAACERRRPPS